MNGARIEGRRTRDSRWRRFRALVIAELISRNLESADRAVSLARVSFRDERV